MKILALMSAGLIAVVAPTAVSAQMDMHRDAHTTVTTTSTVQHDGDADHRDMDQRDMDHRDMDHRDMGRHDMNRHHARRVCSWQWRHHHKVRICRTTRW